jgi:serine/threonine-protein phosphatase 2A regulatory subunit A
MRKDVVKERIVPVLQRLVADSSDLVRCSLASVINEMAVTLGKDDTIQYLLPLLLLLLRDENSEVVYPIN